jgi:hypothetical protein
MRIQKYEEWLNEATEIVNVDDDQFPVLPREIWKELGDRLISAYKESSKDDIGMLIQYFVYRTPADQGREGKSGAKSFVSGVQSLSRSDGKNILGSFSPVKFTHVLGIGTIDTEDTLPIFEKVTEEFAKEKNLIIVKTLFTVGMHSITLFPENWRGTVAARRYGV